MNKYMIIVLLILIGGCSTHRKIDRSKQVAIKDTAAYHLKTYSSAQVDSMEASIRKQVQERSETGTTVIERGNSNPAGDPFKITAAFTIDTSAKGDTLRLVSQENDQVQFSVYYDKKSGQAVAQIQGKGGKVAQTPFEKITITNATVTKNTDSTAHVKSGAVSTTHASDQDSSRGHTVVASSTEHSELTRKQTGISNIVWAIIAIVAGAVLLLIIFRKSIKL